MSDIKVGDTVERIAGIHAGMAKGDTGTVRHICGDEIQLKEFKHIHDKRNFKVLTRPTEPHPQKTVADAWEWNEGEWEVAGCDRIICKGKVFFYSDASWVLSGDDYQVCTREQFEAYGREQEAKQEGEWWTHTWKGDKCRVVFTEGNSSWVQGHFINTIVHTESLKPIKPKLTMKDCSLLVKFKNHIRDSSHHRLDDMLDEFLSEHDIA